MSDVFLLLRECVADAARTQPLLFALWALGGLLFGVASWWAARAWGRLWNRSFRMDSLRSALAALLVVLSTLFTVTGASLQKATKAANHALDAWLEHAEADDELRWELRGAVYEQLAQSGREDMTLIPDPRELAPGQHWEFFYRGSETPFLIAEVFTQGTIRSLAQSHPALFHLLCPDASPESLVHAIRSKTEQSPERVFLMADAGAAVRAHLLASVEPMVSKAVLVARLTLAGAFVSCMGLFLAFLAFGAYKDIRVFRIND